MNCKRILVTVLTITVCLCALLCSAAYAGTLNLPALLETIGTEAFYGDRALDIVVLPNGLTEIKAKAFANSSVTRIVIPATVKRIDDTAFNGVSNLIVVAEKDSYAYNWAVKKGYEIRSSVYEVVEATSYEQFSALSNELTQLDSSVSCSSAAFSGYSSGRLIVKVTDTLPDVSDFRVHSVIRDQFGYYFIQFLDAEDAFECANYLDSLPNVVFVEADSYIISDDVATSNETSYSYKSWGITATNMNLYAYDLAKRNKTGSVTVAVVDSGIYSRHTMFTGHLVAGYDFVDSDTVPQDGVGHGTHVAGTVIDATQGLNVNIMPVRVLGNDGKGSSSNVAQGIRYAADHGAKVINLSLGGVHSNYKDDAIDYAIGKGVIVVVAAGNNSADTATHCPAHIESCITVAAVQSSLVRASFSNYGNAVDICAPGVGIVSAYNNGGYASLNGTSMATPHVSAAAAMLLIDGYSASNVSSLLRNAATDLGTAGRDIYYGAGFLNMESFVKSTYTVSYNANGGTGAPASQTKYTGKDITLSTVVPKKVNTVTLNYGTGETASRTIESTFRIWNTASNGTGTAYNPGDIYVMDLSATLYAIWEDNALGSLPAPTRSGYTFDGWYTAETGGTRVSESTPVTANTAIYAHWTQLSTYTVSYNANGGTGAPASQTKTQGVDLTLSSATPTKSYTVTINYGDGTTSTRSVSATFKNWNTSSSGTGTAYASGATYSANASVTLYAQWNGGTMGTLPVPTRSGYTFDGWYTAATGGARVSESTSVTAHTTIYAHWTQLSAYTVSYNANGGTGAPASQTKTQGVDLTLSSVKPTRSYTVTMNKGDGTTSTKSVSATFKNWNTSSSGTGTAYASGATYSANASVTLYAQWNSATMGTLSTPTRSGYTFDGWYTSSSGGTRVTSSTSVSGNMTIYAHWSADITPLSVEIDANKTSAQVGDTITLYAYADGGTGSYSYQWYYATSRTGSGTKTYTDRTISMTIGEAGSFWYYCVVTSGSETVTSDRIKLTGITALSVSISANKTTFYINGDSCRLTATATGGTGSYSYQWYYATSSTGTGTKTFTGSSISFISSTPETFWYYCVVTSGTQTVTSERIKLTSIS